MLWTKYFVSLQKSCIKALTPNVIVFGVRPSGRWLSHESRGLMNGISILIRKDRRKMTSLSHMRTQQEGIHLQTRKRAVGRNWICLILILNIPAFRPWETNVYCLSHPAYGIFVIASQTDYNNTGWKMKNCWGLCKRRLTPVPKWIEELALKGPICQT